MKRYLFIISIQLMTLAFVGSSTAQEDIIISDYLRSHADMLDVDAEYQSGNSRKFTLGEYSIYADEKLSGIYTKTKERLTGLRVVTDITRTFAFMLNDGTDTAEVYVEEINRTNTYYPNAVLENFILEESWNTKLKSFAAWITIRGDTSTTWTLYVPVTRGKQKKYHFEMLLSDGVSFIEVFPASSDAFFDYAHPLKSMLKMPAMGVEFIDEGGSICAVQSDSGAANNFDMGDRQSFGCKAWMLPDLDARTKLVLAAAMSTIILRNNPYLSIKE